MVSGLSKAATISAVNVSSTCPPRTRTFSHCTPRSVCQTTIEQRRSHLIKGCLCVSGRGTYLGPEQLLVGVAHAVLLREDFVDEDHAQRVLVRLHSFRVGEAAHVLQHPFCGHDRGERASAIRPRCLGLEEGLGFTGTLRLGDLEQALRRRNESQHPLFTHTDTNVNALAQQPKATDRCVGRTGGSFCSPPQTAGPSKPTQMSSMYSENLRIPSRLSDHTQGIPDCSSTSARFFRPQILRKRASTPAPVLSAAHSKSARSTHPRPFARQRPPLISVMLTTLPFATGVLPLSSSGGTCRSEALLSLMKRQEEPMPMSPVWNHP